MGLRTGLRACPKYQVGEPGNGPRVGDGQEVPTEQVMVRCRKFLLAERRNCIFSNELLNYRRPDEFGQAPQAPPNPVVIMGPRGNGKTTLMEKIRREIVSDPSISILNVSAIDLGESPSKAVNALRLAAGTALIRESATSKATLGLRAFLHIGGETRSTDKMIVDNLHYVLRGVVAENPLVLMMDEAHCLDLEVGEQLLNVEQALCKEGHPFLLVLAGTPDLRDSSSQDESKFL